MFELLGFSNPYVTYPDFVIPVGKLDGKLGAVYPAGDNRFDPIGEDTIWVRLTAEQKEKLRGFNPLTQELFAEDEHHVCIT